MTPLKKARITWTSEELASVSDKFVAIQKECGISHNKSLLDMVVEAQSILAEDRRRPTAHPAGPYDIRSRLMDSYRERHPSLILSTTSAPASPVFHKEVLADTPGPKRIRVTPIIEPVGLTPVLSKPMGPPPPKPPIVVKLAETWKIPSTFTSENCKPVSAPTDTPMSTILKRVVREMSAELSPALIAEVADKVAAKVLPEFQAQMSFIQAQLEAIRQGQKEMLDYWGAPAVSTEKKPVVELEMPLMAQGAMESIQPAQQYIGKVKAPAAPKKTVMIFGALDSQRRAYQDHLPGCEIEVSKDAHRAGKLGHYDLVVVLEDFVRVDLKRVLIKARGKDDIRIVSGAVTRGVEQIREFLQKT